MELYYLPTKRLYLPNCYPVEQNGKKLKYFIYGEGWKQTTSFKRVEGISLPDKWDSNITWLQIAKWWDQYGIEVANVYAEKKTAGIVSRQTARGVGIIWRTIKKLAPENFDEAFFNCLSADYMMACFGLFLFDLTKTDGNFSLLDNEYKSNECTYKRKTCSMMEYVQQKWGCNYFQMIEALIQKPLFEE